MLDRFAQRFGIEYSLLSDEGSRTINRLGLLNQHIAQQHTAFGVTVRENHFGVPYPGTFVLDEAGVVRDRWFEQSYRVRPTPTAFLEQSFHLPTKAAVSATAEGGTVRAMASIGSARYHPHQRLELTIELEIADGLHLYTEPIPDGYVPLSIVVRPIEGLEAREIQLPAARMFHLDALDETFHVLDSRARASLPIVLTKNVGDVQLELDVSYQTCSDTECFMPEQLTLHLPLQAEDNVRD